MRKICLATVLAALVAPAFAEPADLMENLTDEQRACVEAKNCSAEGAIENAVCIKNALTECGVEVPNLADTEPDTEPASVEPAPTEAADTSEDVVVTPDATDNNDDVEIFEVDEE